jgi:23S rRNA (adenine1618-N6)-methyltransferase
LWYKGGEKVFLHNYLYESSLFSNKSKWFTSLVSKKENVESLQNSAKKLGAEEFKVINMNQGNKVTRIVCWRF